MTYVTQYCSNIGEEVFLGGLKPILNGIGLAAKKLITGSMSKHRIQITKKIFKK